MGAEKEAGRNFFVEGAFWISYEDHTSPYPPPLAQGCHRDEPPAELGAGHGRHAGGGPDAAHRALRPPLPQRAEPGKPCSVGDPQHSWRRPAAGIVAANQARRELLAGLRAGHAAPPPSVSIAAATAAAVGDAFIELVTAQVPGSDVAAARRSACVHTGEGRDESSPGSDVTLPRRRVCVQPRVERPAPSGRPPGSDVGPTRRRECVHSRGLDGESGKSPWRQAGDSPRAEGGFVGGRGDSGTGGAALLGEADPGGAAGAVLGDGPMASDFKRRRIRGKSAPLAPSAHGVCGGMSNSTTCTRRASPGATAG